MEGRTPSSVRGRRDSVALFELSGGFGNRRALLAWTDEGVRPSMVGLFRLAGDEFWQVLPEEFAAIDYAASAHVEQIYRQHSVFVVVAKHVGVVAFGGGDALAFLQLLDG